MRILKSMMAMFFVTSAFVSAAEQTLPLESKLIESESIEAEFKAEAQHKIQLFAKTLKATLTSAIQAGGLASGVEVCHTQAPQIANSLSSDGWLLARTSLKPRNASNQPTDWQTSVLNQFEQQKNKGKAVHQIAISSLTDNTFQLIKAIPTGSLCLKCHGNNINPSLQATINRLYPHDQATGFSLGDIRGAFVVQKTLSRQNNSNVTNEKISK